MLVVFVRSSLLFVLSVVIATTVCAQEAAKKESPPEPSAPEAIAPPSKVDIEPIARDDQIADRLTRILLATEWFENPDVSVRDGVVFLTGTALNDEYKTWATNLARNTQDTVAVVNKMDIQQSSAWNFKPLFQSLRGMWRSFLEQLPFILLSIFILFLTLLVAGRAQRLSQRVLIRKIRLPLLRDLVARAVATAVFIIGIYTVMRVSGTTQLALTILGGTGLFGLVLGIAFRDITENFLASIFLSMQRPFQIGDLVEIVGIMGHVERLTVRTTVLVTTDGNYVQIPNATVYKNTIRNFTNNPNRRDELFIEIPNTASIEQAQSLALEVIERHPAVLKQPAPWILANKTTANTTELKILYWLDSSAHNILTTRSAIMRMVTGEFASHQLLPGQQRDAESGDQANRGRPKRRIFFTRAEGSASSTAENEILEAQTSSARPVEAGPNLLNGKR